jgi:hypothetical protein
VDATTLNSDFLRCPHRLIASLGLYAALLIQGSCWTKELAALSCYSAELLDPAYQELRPYCQSSFFSLSPIVKRYKPDMVRDDVARLAMWCFWNAQELSL